MIKTEHQSNTEMDTEQLFTLSVFTENRVGLLGRISVLLTRHHVHIERITVSESEPVGVRRHTLILHTTRVKAVKVTAQLRKLVDVLEVSLHTSEQLVTWELALFKLHESVANKARAMQVVRLHQARILELDPEFMIIEKTGHYETIEALKKELEPYGILEFSRSGPVTITRPVPELKSILGRNQ